MASGYHRQHFLYSRGVQQFPTMIVMPKPPTPAQGLEAQVRTASYPVQVHQCDAQQSDKKLIDEDIPIRTVMTLPARKCPVCDSNGKDTWVQPGKMCPECSYAMDD